MKYIFTFLSIILMTAIVSPTFAQTSMSRQEIALKKAEDKLEAKRLKLVDIKIQIEAADSLFVSGELLSDESRVAKAEARDEVKVVEKKFKTESKPLNKTLKSKDRAEAAEARKELKALTLTYKFDLKAAQGKVKAADRNIINSDRMIAKADKKLDMLSQKLKVAEKAYKDAEKSLNDKQSKE